MITITAPSTVRRMPIIYQRVTRNNNPFQILADTDDDNDDDDTVVHSNCSPRVPLLDLLEPLLPTASPTPMPRPPTKRPGVFLHASPPLIPIPTDGPPRNTSAMTIHDIRPGRHKRARPISMPRHPGTPSLSQTWTTPTHQPPQYQLPHGAPPESSNHACPATSLSKLCTTS